MSRFVVAVIFFGALAMLWQLMVVSGQWSPVLLPSPLSVVEYLWGAMSDGSLIEAAAVTLRRLLAGYVIGVTIGLPLGLLTSTSQFFEDTIGSMALGLQTLPSVCWVPLAVLTFGLNETGILFVLLMGSAFAMTIAFRDGLRMIPPIYQKAGMMMGASGLSCSRNRRCSPGSPCSAMSCSASGFAMTSTTPSATA